MPDLVHLNRLDIADIHDPSILALRLHEMLGPITTAVPVVEIAKSLDIMDIRLDRFDGFEGMLLTDKVRSTGSILANTNKGARRARFTVAHELGHFLMERHQFIDTTGFICTSGNLRETRESQQLLHQETQANQFAIELLAPTSLVMPWMSAEPDLRDALQLRKHLDVSLEACVRRMVTLREEPLAAIWSHEGRMQYFAATRNFPFITLKRGDPIPQTSAASRVISRGDRGSTTFVGTHPFPWTERQDLNLHEQTRVAANSHAVTLLWVE
ncbi:MAG: ImmA/IrrE family metallo-endopeptidase [Rhodospirillales bacterium]